MKQKKHNKRILIKVLITGLFLISIFKGVAFSATFTVNSTADAVDASPGDGVCATAGSVCTLRAAIQEANALAGADTITLPAGTYNLSICCAGEDAAAQGDLDIAQDLTINGAGSATTIVDGGAIDRVFQINASVVVSISDITIRNGNPNNPGGVGGGVYNIGVLTLTNCIISGNTAGFGGGIYTAANTTLTINNTTISSNTVGTYGGGIFKANDASVTIDNSTIRNNTTSLSGGNSGGGIYTLSGGSMTIDNSTISSNAALLGGGIVNEGRLNISTSAITGNFALERGGISNTGTMNLTNVTVSGNSTSGWGGGISIVGGSATANLSNVTITNNMADYDNAGGGGGGGIYVDAGGNVNLINTIIAGNTVGASGSAPDCFGTLTSQGYNLIQNTNSCTISGSTTGNLIGQNPNLGPIADNGGPTQTHALLAGSPAIDAGDNTLCPAIDQRGIARPQDGDNNGTAVCDMGAYEVEAIGGGGGGVGNGGGGGGGGGCGGFIQDAGNKNRDNSSLILSFILMLIISLTAISLARRVIRA